MTMLTGHVEHVIGVDTHRDTNTAAVVTAAGAVVAHQQCSTDATGYRRIVAFADEHASGRRVWAIEGTGSFGSGLTTYLLQRGEWVVEIDRPARPARRNGAKTDDLDAVRAAREALTRDHLAAPRTRGDRAAMRVLLAARQGAILARTKAIGQLKALIVNAPEALREQLRRGTTDQQLDRCSRLRTLPSHSVEHRATVRAIRAVARRALFLEAEAAEHETELEELVTAASPELLDRPGIGTITAAQFLVSWSHSGRIRNEAAFAALGGVAPIPASSGRTVRHRLNRSGDRQLNRALHTVARSRLQHHAPTKAYASRRTTEGKTPREIKRCLKRAIARELPPPRSQRPSRKKDQPDRLTAIEASCSSDSGWPPANKAAESATSPPPNWSTNSSKPPTNASCPAWSAATAVSTCSCSTNWLTSKSTHRGAELLFQIITEREERASIAIATNLPFSEWGTVFPDPRLVAAIVDRVTFNAHILETGTDSYRLRTSKTTTRRKRAS